jgi:hypothetical protein
VVLTSSSWLCVEQSSSHDSSCGRSDARDEAVRPKGEGRWCWKEREGDSGEPSGLHMPVAASSAVRQPDMVVNGVLGCKHGTQHWERVERNGLLRNSYNVHVP